MSEIQQNVYLQCNKISFILTLQITFVVKQIITQSGVIFRYVQETLAGKMF